MKRLKASLFVFSLGLLTVVGGIVAPRATLQLIREMMKRAEAKLKDRA